MLEVVQLLPLVPGSSWKSEAPAKGKVASARPAVSRGGAQISAAEAVAPGSEGAFAEQFALLQRSGAEVEIPLPPFSHSSSSLSIIHFLLLWNFRFM